MKYLVAVIIIISLIMPSSVYAWPEPKEYPRGGRWPVGVTKDSIGIIAPPQLDAIRAYRWYSAIPTAKPRLAQLYGIPKEIAIEYGANYIEIGKPQYCWWGFEPPAIIVDNP